MFGEHIDASKINGRQFAIFVLCITVMIIDGLDFQLLAFASPLLIEEWHITKVQLAPALAAALIGMSIGAGFGGVLGDRFGCRRTLLWAVAAFGCTTLASALVTATTQLTVLRFMSGFGFGVAVPVTMALVSEWCPRRIRGQTIVIMSVGTMVGGTVGGLLAEWLIPAYGWRSIFVVSGAGTLLCAGLSTLLLPESLNYLIRRGQEDEAIRWFTRVMRHPRPQVLIAPFGNTLNERFNSGDRLLSKSNFRLNFGLWSGFFSIAFASYAYMSWSPALLVHAGFSVDSSIKCTYLYTFSAVIGCFVSAASLRRIGSLPLVVVSLSISIAASVMMPSVVAKGVTLIDVLYAVMVLAGLGTGISQSTVYAIASTAYPSDYRSTALGVCVGLSRFGGIVSVLCGGMLLELSHDSSESFFLVLASVLGIGLICLFGIDRHTGKKAHGRVGTGA
ncbi:TPA: MFS transporter [Burkholderia cenocepacia]|nr:MFS transporter [Burkholderia cenocepacia]